jgi:hypothetical protein
LSRVSEGLRAGGSHRDVPHILLNGTAIDSSQTQFRSKEQFQTQINANRWLYASVGDAVPGGEYRDIPEATHSSIPQTSPAAVADAVKDVLTRHHHRLSQCIAAARRDSQGSLPENPGRERRGEPNPATAQVRTVHAKVRPVGLVR